MQISRVASKIAVPPVRTRLGIFSLLLFVTGCAGPTFRLTDESAMDRLMATQHVAELQRNNPTPLTCWVEGADPNARQMYLGENHADHTVRVGTYRVTSDGRVWVNADPTQLEEQWAIVE